MEIKLGYVTSLILFAAATLHAQVNPDELIGSWRLEALIGKQISPVEKQKRYVFTADSLFFSSHKINLRGIYTLDKSTEWVDWSISAHGESRILPLYFKSVYVDTIYLWEAGENPVVGILIRIPNESIEHFKKAIDAQQNKNFELAYSEFIKAAQYKHPEAMYQLGMCYFTGTGTLLNEKEGSRWIREAAGVGHKESQAVVKSLRY